MMEGEEGDLSVAAPVGFGARTGIGFSTVAGALGLPNNLTVAIAAVALGVTDIESVLEEGGTIGLGARLDAAAARLASPTRTIPVDIEAKIDEQPIDEDVLSALKVITDFELRAKQLFLPPPLRIQLIPEVEIESLHPLVQGPTAFGGGPGTGGPPSDVGLSPTAPTEGDSPNAP
jgi:hypothetical protein